MRGAATGDLDAARCRLDHDECAIVGEPRFLLRT